MIIHSIFFKPQHFTVNKKKQKIDIYPIKILEYMSMKPKTKYCKPIGLPLLAHQFIFQFFPVKQNKNQLALNII